MTLVWLLFFGGAAAILWSTGRASASTLPRSTQPIEDVHVAPQIEAFMYGIEKGTMTSNTHAGIGTVLPLTTAQIVSRALYLIGELDATKLDPYVRDPDPACTTIYYRLEYPNGGLDPTNKDPAARWLNDEKTFTFITADCVAAIAWCGGWSRKQPIRFGHVPGYNGSINTNSIMIDARGARKCFVPIDRPELGSFVVCESGSPGHDVGHTGVVISVPAEWDATKRECWKALGVANIASMGYAQRANVRTTGVGWYGTGALFVRSVMVP